MQHSCKLTVLNLILYFGFISNPYFGFDWQISNVWRITMLILAIIFSNFDLFFSECWCSLLESSILNKWGPISTFYTLLHSWLSPSSVNSQPVQRMLFHEIDRYLWPNLSPATQIYTHKMNNEINTASRN